MFTNYKAIISIINCPDNPPIKLKNNPIMAKSILIKNFLTLDLVHSSVFLLILAYL